MGAGCTGEECGAPGRRTRVYAHAFAHHRLSFLSQELKRMRDQMLEMTKMLAEHKESVEAQLEGLLSHCNIKAEYLVAQGLLEL